MSERSSSTFIDFDLSDICTLKISGESIYLDRVKCQNNAYLNYAIGSDQNSFSLLGDRGIPLF